MKKNQDKILALINTHEIKSYSVENKNSTNCTIKIILSSKSYKA